MIHHYKPITQGNSSRTHHFIACLWILLFSGSVFGSAITYVEDFNLDSDPAQCGLADSVFQHSSTEPFDESDLVSTDQVGPGFGGVPSISGEATCVLVSAGLNIHQFTFDLTAGMAVTKAAIWVDEVFDNSKLTFIGTLGSVSLFPYEIDAPSPFFVAWNADHAAATVEINTFFEAPASIGNITAVEFSGHDAAFDHLQIEVEQITATPVPAAVWLFGSGLIGLIGIAKRKKA